MPGRPAIMRDCGAGTPCGCSCSTGVACAGGGTAAGAGLGRDDSAIERGGSLLIAWTEDCEGRDVPCVIDGPILVLFSSSL